MNVIPNSHTMYIKATICLLFMASTFYKTYAQTSIISDDGRWVSVIIDKSVRKKSPILVLQSTFSHVKTEIANGSQPVFTKDGKFFLYQLKDTLCIMQLSNYSVRQIPDVAMWKMPKNGGRNVIAYKVKSKDNALVVLNSQMSMETIYKKVSDFWFEKSGNALLIKSEIEERTDLIFINLNNKESSKIWSGKDRLLDHHFDLTGHTLAFLTGSSDKERKLSTSIWYYRLGHEKAKLLLENADERLGGMEICVDRSIRTNALEPESIKSLLLSPNGTKLLFYLKEKPLLLESRPSVSLSYVNAKDKFNVNEVDRTNKVDVWSYLDSRIASAGLKLATAERLYCTVININTKQLLRVEATDNQLFCGIGKMVDGRNFNDNYVLIYDFKQPVDYMHFPDGNPGDHPTYDFDWNKGLMFDLKLISLEDGSSKSVESDARLYSHYLPLYEFSPTGDRVVWYNHSQKNILCYNIEDGSRKNLTKGLIAELIEGPDANNNRNRDYYTGNPFLWYSDSQGVSIIVRDIFTDRWKVSITGDYLPVNVTNGYARRNSVKLDQTNLRGYPITMDPLISDSLLFLFLDTHWFGYLGLYTKFISKEEDPKPLLNENGLYHFKIIRKAKNSRMYLVNRGNSKKPSEWFYTSDFITFHKIICSQIEERKIADKELITWKTFDGKIAQGVLCKPRNFDSTKKNPLIITYYDWASAKNFYQEEKFYDSTGNFMSYKDYLVFIPGIYFSVGETGHNAYDYVVSGAEFLSNRSYINRNRIAIDGESFSGFITNYIITQSKMFACATVGCGWSNMISNFGSIPIGKSFYGEAIWSQLNMGATLWDRPDIYLKNSPVLFADRVETPVLLSHNPNDNAVPFQQGVEMFIALRRLGKRAWLLVSGAGHSAFGMGAFPYKMQFFDHYLKDAPAPKWMLSGIPAREQGNPKWLALDSTGKTPPKGGLVYDSPITTPEQEKLLQRKTRITNDGRVENVINEKKNINKKIPSHNKK